jgi:hypothetical protein
MRYNELCQLLSDEELAAIKFLESRGFQILTDAKLEDGYKKDGGRHRTFTLSGRYNLMLVLKSVLERNVRRGRPVKLPELPETSVDDISEDETGSGTDDKTDNFWLDRSKWIRLGREEFCQLVTEEVTDDLRAATPDVQAAVKEKFDRLCNPDDWPIEE